MRGAGLRTGLGERLGRPCDCLRRLGRSLLVEADDLGEVLGGEAVGAANPGVRYQAPSRSVLDPPGRAAEGVGDLLRAVEAGGGASDGLWGTSAGVDRCKGAAPGREVGEGCVGSSGGTRPLEEGGG